MMATSLYPPSLAELERWQKDNGTTLDEARKRFVQFIVLDCVGAGGVLHELLTFKGGNALRFIYGNPRSTIDLDFTAGDAFPDDEEAIRTRLDAAIRSAVRKHGVKLKCQKVKRQPKSKEAVLPTWQVCIGYQFPTDRYFADYESARHTVSTVVDVEISLNDLVCESADCALPTGETRIRVCVIEDIIAEKLRALLQQKVRNRTRPQDVFDIAQVLRSHAVSLDIEKIARYFIDKCVAREIDARRSAFADSEIRQRASTDYDQLAQETRIPLIPFDDAWQAVIELVEKMAIPE